MSEHPSPLFSVITPVYNPPLSLLKACLSSVLNQTDRDWELILVDDGSGNELVIAELHRLARRDNRVRVIERKVNGGIVAASNDGLIVAAGEFIVLLDHDDTLERDALTIVRRILEDLPDADYVYSDEAIVDPEGEVVVVHHKPAWSPERLRSQMYCGHLSVLRTELVRQVGGFEVGSDGSQDYDLVLRVTEHARRVVHIPRVLYNWCQAPDSTAMNPDAKPWAFRAAVGAVQRHCDRTGIAADVEEDEQLGVQRVRRRITNLEGVSIIIPTRGSDVDYWGAMKCAVVECVRSVIEKSTWQEFEIVVVADRETPDDVHARLMEIAQERLVWVDFDEEFNFSRKCNVGAQRARYDALIFLNDDTSVISANWIEELIGFLSEPDVGLTGAKLVVPDSRMQHGGQCWQGAPGHAFFGLPSTIPGPMAVLSVAREVSGVTAACAATRRSVFEEVGGFCEDFRANYNDVDLSLKIRENGYRIVWTPYAKLWHFESTTRDPTVRPEEMEMLQSRWAHRLVADPYLVQGMIDVDVDALPAYR